MQGKVSMVMPCYNKVDYIGEMFDSIIAQEWDNIQLILVNDGSTDGTREVISAYEPRFAARGYEVIIVDQENAGVCAAAKAGLLRVSGDYVCMVDADDELDPGYVSVKAGWLQGHGEYDLVACEGVHYTGTRDKKTFMPFNQIEIADSDPYLVERFILDLCRVTVWIYMIRISYLHKCRIADTYFTETKGSHEPGYVIPLRAYGGRLKFFSLPLYRFNQSGEGHSQSKQFEHARSFCEEYEKLSHIAIDTLPDNIVDTHKKQEWKSLSTLIKYKRLYGRTYTLPGGSEYSECYFGHLLGSINRIFKPLPPITREDAHNAERLLARAVSYLHAGIEAFSPPSRNGRIIGYGALGRNAAILIPHIAGTMLEPDELWDVAGDGVNARKPDDSSLTAEDIVLIFPNQPGLVGELSNTFAESGSTVLLYERVLAYATLHRFPQLAGKAIIAQKE